MSLTSTLLESPPSPFLLGTDYQGKLPFIIFGLCIVQEQVIVPCLVGVQCLTRCSNLSVKYMKMFTVHVYYIDRAEKPLQLISKGNSHACHPFPLHSCAKGCYFTDFSLWTSLQLCSHGTFRSPQCCNLGIRLQTSPLETVPTSNLICHHLAVYSRLYFGLLAEEGLPPSTRDQSAMSPRTFFS